MAQLPKRSVVAVNGSGGAVVTISASAGSRKVVIRECPPPAGAYTGANFAPQGCNYQLPNDNFATTYALLPAQDLPLGDIIAEGKGAGPLVGGPAQQDPAGRTIPATVYCKIISATVTATFVEVLEYS